MFAFLGENPRRHEAAHPRRLPSTLRSGGRGSGCRSFSRTARTCVGRAAGEVIDESEAGAHGRAVESDAQAIELAPAAFGARILRPGAETAPEIDEQCSERVRFFSHRTFELVGVAAGALEIAHAERGLDPVN